ncbi:efflux RND transporter permease subunit [Escherichia coli]|uniref:efflux RND transporter permease subunit n=1 Tax=Escherichia coli TaxID=562 RepID=UPI00397FDD53
MQVQNKLQLATPLLPQEVQQQGISVEKSSSSYLMVAGLSLITQTPHRTISRTMWPLTLKIRLAVEWRR